MPSRTLTISLGWRGIPQDVNITLVIETGSRPLGFNTRCSPQLLWAIIGAAKQAGEINTGCRAQGHKVKETLLSSLSAGFPDIQGRVI